MTILNRSSQWDSMKVGTDEVQIVGHIIEKDILPKLYEVIKDFENVDATNISISFASIKRSMGGKMFSVLKFYLIGPANKRERAFERIRKIASENDCTVTYIKRDIR